MRSLPATLLTLTLVTCSLVAAQNLLPNPSFEEGTEQPAFWQLKGGVGKWELQGHSGKRCLAITGDGQNSNFWFTPMPDLKPMQPYRLSFWGKTLPGTSGGCFVSGPDFCNRDYGMTESWQRYSSVLCEPTARPGALCRLGQWTVRGTGLFDEVELRPVLPVHSQFGEMELGTGEEIAGDRYFFKSDFPGPGSNYSRCLHGATAIFNSSRWVFSPGTEVIYKHAIAGAEQTEAKVTVTVGWYASGTCLIEASRDLQSWQRVGEMNGLGSKEFSVPAAMLPAAAVYIRLRSPGASEKGADFAPGSFQVYGYAYNASLNHAMGSLQGNTSYLDIAQDTGQVAVRLESLGSLLPGEEEMRAVLTAGQAGRVELAARFEPGQTVRAAAQATAGQPVSLRLPYEVAGDGDHALALTVILNGKAVWAATTSFFVPSLYNADYGHAITSNANADLWWCEGTYKVSQVRPAATVKAPVRLAGARNEYEPVQIIIRPKQPIASLTAEVGDFAGPGGAKIPKSAFTVRQVEYLKVTTPTDGSSTPGWWPDPLPPLSPTSLAADRNYPLWVTVKVPANARPGLYSGTLSVNLGGQNVAVPMQLQVYDFTMPAKSHLTTCWGWSWGRVLEYQNLKDPADQAKVHDLYLQNFREHRISPYDFSQLAPVRVSVEGVNWNGGRAVDDQAAEGQHSLMVGDTSTTGTVSASVAKMIPIEPGATYRLSWAVKTDQPNRNYHLTLGCHDARGEWFSGHNVDLIFPASGEWQRHEVTLGPERFPEGCTQVDLSLRGAQWSEKGERTGTTWWDGLYFGKTEGGPNLITDPSFELGAGIAKVVVDWTAFDQAAAKYLDEYGFNGFRFPLQFLPWGRAPEFHQGAIGGFEEGTPEYESLFAAYAKEVQDHLQQKGWLDEAYLYWFDEPEPADYEFVRRANERIHQAAPGLNRMLTEQPEPALFGVVDTWCPITPSYDREICQERQRLGEKIWWYVCCGPKAPWAGLFIDHGATDLRVWLWQTWQSKLQGCLVWESTWWSSSGAPLQPQNPWTDPMGWTPEGGCWGNGDGRFIYPANRDFPNDKRPYVEGPVDSIRWEMLREGLEDWEYLYLLNQCIAKKLPGAAQHAKLLEVPKDISQDMTHFAREPQPIYARRAQIAAALEKLRADKLGIK